MVVGLGWLYVHFGGLGHSHDFIDPSIVSTKKGLQALKWSFFGLMITFITQGEPANS